MLTSRIFYPHKRYKTLELLLFNLPQVVLGGKKQGKEAIEIKTMKKATLYIILTF